MTFASAARELLDWCSDNRAFQLHFELNLMKCLTVSKRPYKNVYCKWMYYICRVVPCNTWIVPDKLMTQTKRMMPSIRQLMYKLSPLNIFVSFLPYPLSLIFSSPLSKLQHLALLTPSQMLQPQELRCRVLYVSEQYMLQ